MNDEWIRNFADHRTVKFTDQELDERALLAAQVEATKSFIPSYRRTRKTPYFNRRVPVENRNWRRALLAIKRLALCPPTDFRAEAIQCASLVRFPCRTSPVRRCWSEQRWAGARCCHSSRRRLAKTCIQFASTASLRVSQRGFSWIPPIETKRGIDW